jgi:hypothetical protein
MTLFNQIDSILSALGTPSGNTVRYRFTADTGTMFELVRCNELVTVACTPVATGRRTPLFYQIEGQAPQLEKVGSWKDEVERVFRSLAWTAQTIEFWIEQIRETSAPRAAGDVAAALQTAAYYDNGPVAESLRREMIVALVTLTRNDEDARHALTSYLFGKPSTKLLTAGEAQALVDWIEARKVGDRWVCAAEATAEYRAIMRGLGLPSVRRAA